MSSRKFRAGISFDSNLAKKLDFHAEKLEGLAVDRSEIVNAILSDYFEDNGSSEAVWDAVRKRRVKRRR